MGRGPSIDIFSQGRHTNVQQTQEKWLNIINLQTKRNQTCNEVHLLQEEWLLQTDKNPQVDKGHMRPGNFTRISQFILQLSEKPELQHLIFAHFLPCSRSLCLKTCSLSCPPSLIPTSIHPCNSFPICSFKICFTFTTIPKKAKP